MKQIGAGLLDRTYAAETKLKATIHQTEQILTIAARGPGWALDETLYLDGRTDPSNQQLLGATAVETRAAWSQDGKRLVATPSDQNQTGKTGPTDHHAVPDKRREKLGGCLHPKARRRTRNLCPPNLEQASLSTGSRSPLALSGFLRFFRELAVTRWTLKRPLRAQQTRN